MVTVAALIGYLTLPVIIILVFNRFEWAKKVGTVIMAYAAGIVAALTGALPTGMEAGAEELAGIQRTLMNVTVPIAIPLMLFSSDFRLWARSLPKTMVVLFGGLFSVLVAVVSGYLLFRNAGIPQFGRVAALMTGIYTGGTMNFAAIGSMLKIDPSLLTLTLTFEEIITFPLILFLVAGGYKLVRRLLPDRSGEAAVGGGEGLAAEGFEDYRGMLRPKTFGRTALGLLLAVAMLAAGAGLSLLVTGQLNELIVILTITTLAILASFSPKVRAIPKTFELGMFFILVFSVVVASQFNIHQIGRESVRIFLFILFVMITSVVLHLIICRLFKVDGDLFIVGNVSLLCSPPFVPPVVEALGNPKVLVSGIVVGLAGYALGTFMGSAVAWLLGALPMP